MTSPDDRDRDLAAAVRKAAQRIDEGAGPVSDAEWAGLMGAVGGLPLVAAFADAWADLEAAESAAIMGRTVAKTNALVEGRFRLRDASRALTAALRPIPSNETEGA